MYFFFIKLLLQNLIYSKFNIYIYIYEARNITKRVKGVRLEGKWETWHSDWHVAGIRGFPGQPHSKQV